MMIVSDFGNIGIWNHTHAFQGEQGCKVHTSIRTYIAYLPAYYICRLAQYSMLSVMSKSMYIHIYICMQFAPAIDQGQAMHGYVQYLGNQVLAIAPTQQLVISIWMYCHTCFVHTVESTSRGLFWSLPFMYVCNPNPIIKHRYLTEINSSPFCMISIIYQFATRTLWAALFAC